MRIQTISEHHIGTIQRFERRRQIHPTAIVDPRAELAEDVTVGPYSIIEGNVTIGAGSVVLAHSIIQGATIVGRNCRIGPAAYLGLEPQDLKFKADESNPTYLVIGDNVQIRECARLSRATVPGEENATKIGDHCFIMGASHVGHDCVVERDVMLADSALLGGFVRVGEKCFIGGGSTIHQFVRIGRLSIIGGNEASTQDVPPFGAMRYGRLKAYNAVGCRRAGLTFDVIHAIRACYHRLKEYATMASALEAIQREVADIPEVREFVEFIKSSRRGIAPSRANVHDADSEGCEESVRRPDAGLASNIDGHSRAEFIGASNLVAK